MSTERAPSIGSTSMSFDPSGLRVRQIIEAPTTNPQQLTTALRRASTYAARNGATRIVVRALVPDLQAELPNGFTAEAAIPLSGNFKGLHLAYFGGNHPERFSNVVPEEMELLARVQERPRKSPAAVLRAAEQRGFRLERLQGCVSGADRSRLVAMYRASFQSYPFSIEDKLEDMIGDPDTHVYGARSTKTEQLGAVAATEQVVLDTGNGPFIMREMGDSARMPEVGGLNAPLKLALIGEAALSGTDVLFCESRAALAAVNAINHDIGMEHYGLLPKQTVISGPADIDEVGLDGVNGRYGNLHVWALNGDQVQSIGAEVQAHYALR